MTGFKEEISGTEVKCPCGGAVTVGYTSSGDPMVTHTVPYCQKFHELDGLDFVVWIRQQTVGYLPDEQN